MSRSMEFLEKPEETIVTKFIFFDKCKDETKIITRD